jgi:hypothetical protein
MSYRPYPRADRALHQIERGSVHVPRQPSEFELRLAAQANAALAALAAAGRSVGPAIASLRETLARRGA